MKKSGKQATRGEKQILEENKQTISFYSKIILYTNVIFLALNILLFWNSFTLKFIILYVLTAIASYVAYFYMKSMATPVLGNNGEIIDAGSDLNMEGHISEYLKDVVLFVSGVQILSLITSYAWLLLIIIPVYGFYKLWVLVLGPWFFAPAPEEPAAGDAGEEKQKRRVQRVQRR